MSDKPQLDGCHVEIHVTDLDKAWHFYVEQLGLTVLQTTPAIGLLAVRAGSIRVSIFCDAGRQPTPGMVHLVLSAEDLNAQIFLLAARGVEFAGPVIEAPGFCRFVQTHDPDGNLVEIAQYLRDPLEVV